MRYLSEDSVNFRTPAPVGGMTVDSAIELITKELESLGGVASITRIPVGVRTVFGEYRSDPTSREALTLLIVTDETRPLAEAELFLYVEPSDDNSPESLSRSDEKRPGTLLLRIKGVSLE